MTSQLPAPQIINTQSGLRKLALHLKRESCFAVDTESNSLYAYHERVCLIQISTLTQDWLIDPLALDTLSPLAPLFADPTIEKVFHAAEYDLMCMKRDFGFEFNNLFDTMLSARVAGLKAFGLGSLLETYFELQVDKRFQRADWSLRPIPLEQLQYAQQDTHYLLSLRDILHNVLCEQNCLVEAREIFALLTEVPPAEHIFDPDGFWRIHAARDCSRRQFALLRELYLLREQLAEQRNRPPFKVLTDEVLTAIALQEPETLKDLGAIPGMSHSQLDRYGQKIMLALQRGQKAPLPTRPDRNPRLDAATQARFDALHEWRKRRAIERGVESDVILSKDAMWALAHNAPQSLDELDTIPGLGPWKREKYGEELIGLIVSLEQGNA
ncbi:MAG: HRDC domain-containing protein [Chloroflexota bacterium]